MKKTKQYSTGLIISCFAALFCLFCGILLFCGLVLPPQYEESFLGEMKYKLERLKTTVGKRIVLVGGSNIPFGVNSQLLEDAFPDYTVVNFGMYADMGTLVMMDWAKAEIHEGDIFVLMPEQNSQTLSCYFSGEDVWQSADGAMELVSLLPASRYEKLAASFPIFAGKKLYHTVMNTPVPEGVYTRSSFNEYGDITYGQREYNIMSGKYNPNDLISFSTTIIEADFIEEMNSFAEEVTSAGAAVCYHFPPMNEAALNSSATESSIDSYFAFLQKKLIFSILGNPHHCVMDSGWFYDTNFHLNDSGSLVFTASLIEDLKVFLLDTSITNIELPSMPETPLLLAEGDNSCASCFLYQQETEGLIITGLTEKGQTASCLVLPTVHEGAPVVGISQDLFHGNTVLEELTVQANIGVLYDEMFHGCTNFKRLILTGSPSDYSVGDSLMKNFDFLIYVPEETIDSYRRHYSWQKYSSYLVPANASSGD